MFTNCSGPAEEFIACPRRAFGMTKATRAASANRFAASGCSISGRGSFIPAGIAPGGSITRSVVAGAALLARFVLHVCLNSLPRPVPRPGAEASPSPAESSEGRVVAAERTL